jgi:FkbM family methyltransferase
MKLLTRLAKPITKRIGPRLAATAELREYWNKLSDVFQENGESMSREYFARMLGLRDRDESIARIMNLVCEGNEVFLAHGVMRFADRYSLWILINEILVNEDYYFQSDTDSPRILDCGTHFGLAIYYFKNLYPKARITGFEPVPTLRELALKNVAGNGYVDVEIVPYALSDTDEDAHFLVSNTSSMAGSLTKRRCVSGDDVSEITVQCKRLSEYLDEPVDYLKLDIEGSEDIVLAEAEERLGNVHHIFCEYHHGNGLPTDRLAKILSLLDRVGFDAQVGKAFGFQGRSRQRPMSYVREPYSAAIWAANRNWKHRPAV